MDKEAMKRAVAVAALDYVEVGAWVGAVTEIVHHALALPAEISLRVRREFGRIYRAGVELGVESRE